MFFFIELDNDVNIGTELKLYLDTTVDGKSIVDYIRKVMQDIKYPINIRYLDEKEEEKQLYIPAHSVRRQGELEKFKFFIPFLENGDVGQINYLDEVFTNKYIDKYQYGLFICKKRI